MDFLGGNCNLLCNTVFYEKHSADITIIKSSKDVFILRGMEALAGLVPLTPANISPFKSILKLIVNGKPELILESRSFTNGNYYNLNGHK